MKLPDRSHNIVSQSANLNFAVESVNVGRPFQAVLKRKDLDGLRRPSYFIMVSQNMPDR